MAVSFGTISSIVVGIIISISISASIIIMVVNIIESVSITIIIGSHVGLSFAWLEPRGEAPCASSARGGVPEHFDVADVVMYLVVAYVATAVGSWMPHTRPPTQRPAIELDLWHLASSRPNHLAHPMRRSSQPWGRCRVLWPGP